MRKLCLFYLLALMNHPVLASECPATNSQGSPYFYTVIYNNQVECNYSFGGYQKIYFGGKYKPVYPENWENDYFGIACRKSRRQCSFILAQ